MTVHRSRERISYLVFLKVVVSNFYFCLHWCLSYCVVEIPFPLFLTTKEKESAFLTYCIALTIRTVVEGMVT